MKKIISPLSENAKKVLGKRYLKKDQNGRVIESPDEMFWRVARNITQAEKHYNKAADCEKLAEQFYTTMANLEFLPNSPTLMNAGGELQQLAACFVLPIEDSMESIFDAVKNTSLIHKCLVPGTLVMTDRGLIQLNEVTARDKVLTEEGFFEVKSLHKNGEQPVIEVVTRRGYSIKGTAEHRLLVVDEKGDYVWRIIGDLQRGDWVIMKPGQWKGKKNKFPKFNFKEKPYLNSGCFRPQSVKIPELLTVELAELIGLYIGDGSNHRDGIRFCVSEEDTDLLKKICHSCLKVFGRKTVISKGIRKGSYEVSLLSVKIKKWFEEMGILKPSSRNAKVPQFIFLAEEKEVCAFLRGLFSADGCVRESGHITLTTSSAILVRQVQQIMLYLGIPTHKKYYSCTDSFQLSVCSKDGFINFKEKIGFLNQKKRQRLESIGGNEIFLRGETIPNQEFRLRQWYDGLIPAKKRMIQHRIDEIINGSNRRELSKQVAVGILENEQVFPEFVKDLIKESFFFDQVKDIFPLGVSMVYDITVPTKHSYIADGFVGHNSGGGTGFSFSRLRPKNSRVRSTGGVASGPVSFLKVFDAATQAVKQGGSRRGANMGILRVDHPDILEFISCKESDKDITNFNISVAITEDFMQRVKNNQEYDLVDPHTKEAVGRLNAKDVFTKIVQMAWKNGEPGIIFLDRINRYNPTPALGEIESTNPCGEQPILPYECCDLGSINLSKMVEAKKIDWQKLTEVTKLAVRFLDNVIDMNKYPLLKIEEITKGNRKIGLGVMGFADMLIQLEIPYNSEQAIALARKVMDFILAQAMASSCELAKEKGVFPNFDKSVFNIEAGARLRNATLTTIAPTGTLSIIANTSSGIEPIFAVCYLRKVLDEQGLPEIHPIFERIAKERGFYSVELIKLISRGSSIQDIAEIPEDVRRIFVTAHDITPEWHIRMQAAFQQFTHNAVSKTVNFSQHASVQEVEKVYQMAYELGCKGVTIYRDRSRQEQVLNVGKSEESMKSDNFLAISPRPRPQVVTGTTTKITTGCGNLYITINEDEQGCPFEVFMQMGKAGGCAASQLEAIGRLVSLALRSGIDLKSVIDQLRGIRCPSPSWSKDGRIFSCADAIARVIEIRLSKRKNLSGASEELPEPLGKTGGMADKGVKVANIVGVCPDCGSALRHEEGCVVCVACGYTRC